MNRIASLLITLIALVALCSIVACKEKNSPPPYWIVQKSQINNTTAEQLFMYMYTKPPSDRVVTFSLMDGTYVIDAWDMGDDGTPNYLIIAGHGNYQFERTASGLWVRTGMCQENRFVMGGEYVSIPCHGYIVSDTPIEVPDVILTYANMKVTEYLSQPFGYHEAKDDSVYFTCCTDELTQAPLEMVYKVMRYDMDQTITITTSTVHGCGDFGLNQELMRNISYTGFLGFKNPETDTWYDADMIGTPYCEVTQAPRYDVIMVPMVFDPDVGFVMDLGTGQYIEYANQ
jgi:hypothetical protein